MFAPFQEEHEQFRSMVRAFVEREIRPYADEWEKQRLFPNELFRKAGELGILGAHFSEEHGGGGGDYWFSVVKAEEYPRGRSAGVSMGLLVQSDMATPVIADLGTPGQIEEFLKPALRGEKVAALGVSEPAAGSDVAGRRITVHPDRSRVRVASVQCRARHGVVRPRGPAFGPIPRAVGTAPVRNVVAAASLGTSSEHPNDHKEP